MLDELLLVVQRFQPLVVQDLNFGSNASVFVRELQSIRQKV
jgi:hypothetical protein